MLIFSIKEFTNLKPLILLLGISKVQDIQSAKKLITTLCLNSEKGLLIDKLGNLLKSHLDFMTWFQQIKRYAFLFLRIYYIYELDLIKWLIKGTVFCFYPVSSAQKIVFLIYSDSPIFWFDLKAYQRLKTLTKFMYSFFLKLKAYF